MIDVLTKPGKAHVGRSAGGIQAFFMKIFLFMRPDMEHDSSVQNGLPRDIPFFCGG